MTRDEEESGSHVSLEPGAQAVAKVPAMDDPLRFLPPDAFESLLVVSTRGDPGGVEERVRNAGGDPSQVLVVPVSGTSLRYDGPLRISERVPPSDMTKVGINFTNGLGELDEDAWVVVDNFNVFLMYADEDLVYRFMNSLTNEARQAGVRGLYCTVRDAIDDTTYEKFRQLCDEELDLR